MKTSTKVIIGAAAAFILINAVTRKVSASGEVSSIGNSLGESIGTAIGDTTASTLWNVPASYFNWFVNKGEQISESIWNLGDDNKLWQ